MSCKTKRFAKRSRLSRFMGRGAGEPPAARTPTTTRPSSFSSLIVQPRRDSRDSHDPVHRASNNFEKAANMNSFFNSIHQAGTGSQGAESARHRRFRVVRTHLRARRREPPAHESEPILGIQSPSVLLICNDAGRDLTAGPSAAIPLDRAGEPWSRSSSTQNGRRRRRCRGR
jgi:hypothetical protein